MFAVVAPFRPTIKGLRVESRRLKKLEGLVGISEGNSKKQKTNSKVCY